MKRVRIFPLYQYTVKSFISHSVFDSNLRIIFSCRTVSFQCHMGAGQPVYFISSLNFLSNWEFGAKNFFLNSGQIIYFLDINHQVLCTPLLHSNVCRDSVPRAIFPLFSHQDPARTCYSVSMGQRQGRREEEGRVKL